MRGFGSALAQRWKELKWRNDDIVICSYAKAGTTLTQQVSARTAPRRLQARLQVCADSAATALAYRMREDWQVVCGPLWQVKVVAGPHLRA
jgi:hypothetical protein